MKEELNMKKELKYLKDRQVDRFFDQSQLDLIAVLLADYSLQKEMKLIKELRNNTNDIHLTSNK